MIYRVCVDQETGVYAKKMGEGEWILTDGYDLVFDQRVGKFVYKTNAKHQLFDSMDEIKTAFAKYKKQLIAGYGIMQA